MIAEIRTYKIKTGRCDEFIKFFQMRAVPALRAYGMIIFGLLSVLIVVLSSTYTLAQSNPGGAKVQQAAEERDGQHDFDFEFGAWKAHIRRLLRPLTGSKDWVDYDGISIVRKVWDGR